MIRVYCFIFAIAAFAADAATPIPAVPWDFTGPSGVQDGIPDILWRRKSNVDTYAWAMGGSPVLAYNNYVSQLPSTGDPSNVWQIVGVADFGTSHANITKDNLTDI